MRRYAALLAPVVLLLAGCSGAKPAFTPDLADIHGLAVDPEDSNRLFVATHSGLYVLEGGTKWSERALEPFDMMGFAIHPRNGSIMYASGHPQLKGVQKSTDGGRTWSGVALEGQADFHAFALSRLDASRLWGYFDERVWYSGDAGATWDSWTPRGATAFHSFATHPLNVNRLYASAPTGVFQSDDGGHYWSPILNSSGNVHGSAVATSQSEPQLLYAYFPGAGLKRSEDGGTSWETVASPLSSQDVVGVIAIDPKDAETVYLSTNRAAIHRTKDAGATWTTLYAGY